MTRFAGTEQPPLIVRVAGADFTFTDDGASEDPAVDRYFAGELVIAGVEIPAGIEVMRDGTFRVGVSTGGLDAEGHGTAGDAESATILALHGLVEDLEEQRDSLDADITKIGTALFEPTAAERELATRIAVLETVSEMLGEEPDPDARELALDAISHALRLMKAAAR